MAKKIDFINSASFVPAYHRMDDYLVKISRWDNCGYYAFIILEYRVFVYQKKRRPYALDLAFYLRCATSRLI